MPIEHFGGGTTISGDSISYLQLVAQRGAVGLELKGMRVSRGPVLWKRLRDYYQIPKRSAKTGKPVAGKANAQDVYNWLDARVQELRPQQMHVTKDPVTGREIREVNGREIS